MPLRISMLFLLLLTASLRADGWLFFNRSLTATTCPPTRFPCTDDYRPKSMPCACPTAPGCVDDYCAKPMPSACPTAPGCRDDYCPKWFPLCLPPSIRPGYICGPGSCDCRRE